MARHKRAQFFGTEEETYYRTGAGKVYCVQSPDLVGVCDFSEADAVPDGAIKLTEWECMQLSEIRARVDAIMAQK